jgi:hypothetical protein
MGIGIDTGEVVVGILDRINARNTVSWKLCEPDLRIGLYHRRPDPDLRGYAARSRAFFKDS